MAVKYEIDLNETGREFPHYWELCVGSCHAATVLREDVRSQIRKAHGVRVSVPALSRAF